MNAGIDDDTLPTEDQTTLTALREAVLARSHQVVDWAARSDAGRVRARNEDAWGQVDERVFVVADGMGGHDGGSLAAQSAVAALLEVAAGRHGGWGAAVADVNQRVRGATAAAGVPAAGTTLVAVIVGGHRATIVSVGDSRVMRCRRGRVEVLTKDHTVRAAMLAAGIDADAERARGVRTGGLTAFVGMDPARLLVDVVDVDLAHGDRFLLCTDGIHRFVGHRAVAATLTGAACCDDTVADLVALADQAGGRDNATAVVVDVATRDRSQEHDIHA